MINIPNPNKFVWGDIPETIVKLTAEKRTGRLYTILKGVNKTGKISAIWKPGSTYLRS